MTKTFGFSRILGAVAVVLISSAAQAAPIVAGGNAFALPEAGPVGGTVVASLTVPLTTATFTGSLTSQVIAGDVTNPLGLTFTYQIQNDVGSAHAITRMTVNGFLGSLTDMSYLNASGTIAPTLNDRDASGNVVGFRYVGAPIGPGTIAPGALTDLMVVQTDSLVYGNNLAIVIDGSVATVDSFAPRAIPEPVSAGAALLAAGLLRRRR